MVRCQYMLQLHERLGLRGSPLVCSMQLSSKVGWARQNASLSCHPRVTLRMNRHGICSSSGGEEVCRFPELWVGQEQLPLFREDL